MPTIKSTNNKNNENINDLKIIDNEFNRKVEELTIVKRDYGFLKEIFEDFLNLYNSKISK